MDNQVRGIVGKLLDKLSQAVDELDRQVVAKKPEQDGEELPHVKTLVDRAGLKQLISALKELLELLQERQEDTTQCQQLLVKLEGELEDYAK